MTDQIEKLQKEAQKLYDKQHKGILSIANTEGYKQIVAWFTREEEQLDEKLSTCTGQELEVAVKVRNEVRKFLRFLENITKED